MTTTHLQLGEIYRTEWDDRPFRVIGGDQLEVFYDYFDVYANTWSFSGKLSQKCYFYKAPTPLFLKGASLLDYLPLSTEELNIFKPELPIRIARSSELCWNAFESTSYEQFINEAKDKLGSLIFDQRIQTDQMILVPYGKKGWLKKGILINADNFSYLEVLPLIWKAKSMQEAVNHQVSRGIGIYRLGIEQGRPSYYIGEYNNIAGN